MNKRDLKQIKKAYRELKQAYKVKDKKIIHNSICWLIATCESVKPKEENEQGSDKE